MARTRMARWAWGWLALGLALTIGLALILGAVLSRPEATPAPTEAGDYLFSLREPVTFAIDFSQHSVCDSRFAGGQILDAAGEAVAGLTVVIRAADAPTGEGDAIRVPAGNALEIGVGGWHTSLFRLGEADGYTAELRGPADELLAAPVAFSFPVNCAENMAELNFVQTAD